MIRDCTYTTLHGRVASYHGAELLHSERGYVLRVGLPATGTAAFLSSQGRIVELEERNTPDFWRRAAGTLWSDGQISYRASMSEDRATILRELNGGTQ
jgi:hypothetical protein